MTWSAWVSPQKGQDPEGQIISLSDGNAGWQLKVTTNAGKRSFGVAVSGAAGSRTQRCSKTVYSFNTWYYVTGVYNALAQTLNIYVNGVLDNGALSGTVPSAQVISPVNPTIGRSSGGSYFKGIIDEVSIYSRALSAVEIQNNMNAVAAAPVYTANLTPAMAKTPVASDDPAAQTAATFEGAVSSLACSPRRVAAGQQVSCELTVQPAGTAMGVRLASSGRVKVPAAVFTRAHQRRLTFQAAVDTTAKGEAVTISAAFAGQSVEDILMVADAAGPVITAPGKQLARFGTPRSFDVAGADATNGPVQLTAANLPAGAYFDWVKGRFEWTPTAAQAGRYEVTFTATDLARQSATASVQIDVAAGTPELTGELRCSPGAIGTLTGNWLAEAGSVRSDASGTAVDLGGTRVKVNGQYAPVLFASPARVNFVCPTAESGTALSVMVEVGESGSAALNSAMLAASPEVFPLNASGMQGMITFAGSDAAAMVRSFASNGYPAQPGDEVVIWATGLGAANDGSVRAKVGGVDAEVQSVTAVPGHAGLYAVRISVPAAGVGDAVPVILEVGTPAARFASNTVTIALEAAAQ
jgi:uncharacterized protein (TIGR03437 family)